MGSGPSKIQRDFQILGKPIPERYIGLTNKGSTCYVNSVIQALYFCKEFRSAIIEEPRFPPYSLANNLRQLFIGMAQGKKQIGVFNPSSFLSALRSLYEIFDNQQHHDSHEFLVALLDHIDSELLKIYSNSWISSMFQGKSQTRTTCLGCNTVSTRDEIFLALSLEVKQNCSLLYSLNTFSHPETMDGNNQFFCDKCNSKQDAVKSEIIHETPNILVCHLKRFKYSESLGRYTKVGYRVAFPGELRLPNISEECPHRLYELFAVVVHIGTGFELGHYMAFVRSFGHWIRFDDEYIERVDENLIRYIFGNSRNAGAVPCGYLLFYRMRS